MAIGANNFLYFANILFMSKLIELEADDAKIWIETVDAEVDGTDIREVGVLDEVEKNLEKSMSVIKPFCKALLSNFEALPRKPDLLQAEFGLAFNGEVGAFIAKVGAEVKVTIQWRNANDNT